MATAIEQFSRRRVYMGFMERNGWHITFLEADLKTPLGRRLTFQTERKIFTSAERGGASLTLADRQAIQHEIDIGRGGVWLSLTPEQYAKLL